MVCILTTAFITNVHVDFVKYYTKHRPSLFISHSNGDNLHYALVTGGRASSAVKINFGMKLNLIARTSVMCHYAAVASQFKNLEMIHRMHKVVHTCTRQIIYSTLSSQCKQQVT
jgi:hypothetical protein